MKSFMFYQLFTMFVLIFFESKPTFKFHWAKATLLKLWEEVPREANYSVCVKENLNQTELELLQKLLHTIIWKFLVEGSLEFDFCHSNSSK